MHLSTVREGRRLPVLATLCAAIALTGCANYQFEQARRADGSWDIPKLVQDLEASSGESLYSGIWIPLIYADLTVFSGKDPVISDGYALEELAGYGPSFFVGAASKTLINDAQEAVDRQEAWWGLWGLGVKVDREQTVTESGERVRDEWRALLLFHGEDLDYEPREASETAGR
jgi:hypothetical protein